VRVGAMRVETGNPLTRQLLCVAQGPSPSRGVPLLHKADPFIPAKTLKTQHVKFFLTSSADVLLQTTFPIRARHLSAPGVTD
jgi:hypothetical protein